MLAEIGFPSTMVNWIMLCIQTVSYTFQINGHLTDTIIANIYFCHLIGVFAQMSEHTLRGNPSFKFHSRCHKFGITHLCFADDLLMNCGMKTDLICHNLAEPQHVFILLHGRL